MTMPDCMARFVIGSTPARHQAAWTCSSRMRVMRASGCLLANLAGIGTNSTRVPGCKDLTPEGNRLTEPNALSLLFDAELQRQARDRRGGLPQIETNNKSLGYDDGRASGDRWIY
jgi:hypothetical protein